MCTYFGYFESRDDVAKEFRANIPDSVEILFAAYGSGGYDGDAFVLYREGGRLYEVNGSHCSCYGLEDQWEPEETTVESLKSRKYILSDYSHKQDAIMQLGVVLNSLAGEAHQDVQPLGKG